MSEEPKNTNTIVINNQITETPHSENTQTDHQNNSLSSNITSYTPSLIKSFKTCEKIKSHELGINNIDFSEDCTQILTSSNDHSISVLDIPNKKIIRHLINKTYDCDKAIFTHNTKAILCAGKTDYRIMYWCLHSNEILYSFLGHSDVISNITLNPSNDYFLTTSNDRTSRWWDLHNKKCICIFQDSNCATFDDTGNVWASVTSVLKKNNDTYDNYINLYNVEDIKSAFDVFAIHSKFEVKWIKITIDGNIIACVTKNEMFCWDAYNGKKYGGVEIEDDCINDFDITPDSKFVAVSLESGFINVYDMKGENINNFEFHVASCNCIKFCKKYALMASADTNLVLWILDDENKNETENKDKDKEDIAMNN